MEVSMPYLISRPRLRRLICTLVGAAALATVAPAVADACTVSTANESQPFVSLGDSAWYTLAPGGAFASGTTSGWTLNGATVQNGGGPSGNHLAFGPGSAPISAPFCVSAATPTFRFYARQTSGSWAEMNVNVLWTDGSGVTHTTTAAGLNLTPSWTVTPIYNLGNMLPTQAGATFSVRIQFVPAAYGGAVSIDNLYVDPYSR
jgi:hypothetical protein